jgi:putative protease
MEEPVGKITHFFDKISVAVIDLSAELKVGDKIHIKGQTTDFEQGIDSMQLDKSSIESADSGQIAVKVADKVRAGDQVFKVTE